ncbi:MAG: phycobiliprotein lyase, partial [Cyanobacteriota bacterium]
PPTFPPTDIASFLRCCEGSWMSLRSRFDLTANAAAEPAPEGEGSDANDTWPQSERGELEVRYVAGPHEAEPGSLSSQPAGAGARTLQFHADGRFVAADAVGDGGSHGTWTLWPDGILELSLEPAGRRISERIWFTKPNLRLRSTVEHFSDGRAGRASFSSEIRRVSRPAAS